jgi:hypothetical protein
VPRPARHPLRLAPLCVAATLLPASASGAPVADPGLPFPSCASLVAYGNQHLAQAPSFIIGTAGQLGSEQVPGSTAPQTTVIGSTGQTASQGTPGVQSTPNATRRADPPILPAESTAPVRSAAGSPEQQVTSAAGTVYDVADGRVRARTTRRGRSRLVGSLDLGGDADEAMLLTRGTRLLLLTRRGLPRQQIGPVLYFAATQVVLREIDIRDPRAMRITRTMTIDGDLRAARQTGASLRLDISTLPSGVGLVTAPDQTRTWVPTISFLNALSAHGYVAPVAACDTIRHPLEFTGIRIDTVLVVDLDRGLYVTSSTATMR